jgi:glucose-1-phosphate cytidylyltransferase
MKCVILAGGRGSRLGEETHLRPKPMIEVGGRPILWHIMKIFGAHGVNDFVICLGYRGYVIKEYFVNYFLHESDVTVEVDTGAVTFHENRSEPWRVTLVDTGDATLTGGRLLRVAPYLDDEPFLLAYGDGVGDIDVSGLIRFHESHERDATMVVVRPPARFGRAQVEDDRVARFEEKPQAAEGLINGGWFVLSPAVLSLIEGDHTSWETTPLERLAASGELAAWRHEGFWQPMDTVRERDLLEDLWASGDAPWRCWS